MKEPTAPTPARSARRLWIGLAVVLLALPVTLYALLFWRWHSVTPEVTFDPLDVLNAPALAVPMAERAWPMLRDAWAAGGMAELTLPERNEDGVWEVEGPEPVGFSAPIGGYGGFGTPLPRVAVDPAAWLETHAELLAAGRRAAGFDGFGWLASGPEVPAEEVAALFGGRNPYGPRVKPADEAARLAEESAIGILLPAIGILRRHGRLLAFDAEVAAAAGDGDRWLADLAGIEALGRFAGETPTIINGLVCLALLAQHNVAVIDAVRARPDGFDEATLAAVAGRLAGQRIRGVLRLDGERLAIRDTLQRTHGPGPGGRLNATGTEVLERLGGSGGGASSNEWLKRARNLADPIRLLVTPTRAEEEAIMSGYFDEVAEALRRPARDAATPSPSARAGFHGPGFGWRHPVLRVVMPALDHLIGTQAQALGRLDAARLAVALARSRLSNGAWPDRLDALVPAFLEALPVDRITGDPLRYEIRDDRPVVWSVGADRDDDGGQPAEDGAEAAARWGERAVCPPDGDWVLLGADG